MYMVKIKSRKYVLFKVQTRCPYESFPLLAYIQSNGEIIFLFSIPVRNLSNCKEISWDRARGRVEVAGLDEPVLVYATAQQQIMSTFRGPPRVKQTLNLSSGIDGH